MYEISASELLTIDSQQSGALFNAKRAPEYFQQKTPAKFVKEREWINKASCDIVSGVPRANQEKGADPMPAYYPIDEAAARRAKAMNSLQTRQRHGKLPAIR